MQRTLIGLLFLLQIAWGQTVTRNVPYVREGSKEQIIDIFLPAKTPRALVIFVYGGGWHAPRGAGVDHIAQAFVDQGYACALVSHRLGPQDKFPAQAEDVATAIGYLHRRADLPHSIALIGHSSGANLCLLMVTNPSYLAKMNMSAKDIQCVIGLSTPLDLRPKPGGVSFGDALLGGHGADTFNRDLKVLANASPMTHLPAKLPKTLLIAGDQDMPSLASDATLFGTKTKNVTVRIEPHCGHMGTVGGVVDAASPIHRRVFDFLAAALS